MSIAQMMETTGKRKIKTLLDAIRQRAEEKPDEEAFVFIDKFDDRIALTRQNVWDYSKKFAAILKRNGIEKGDIVCNTLVNSPERVITAYGTITVGAITMHGQVLLTDGEDLLHNLKTSKCKSIIVDIGKGNDALTFLNRISYKDEDTGKTRYKDLPYLTTVIKLKIYSDEREDPSSSWLFELKNEREVYAEEDLDEDDVVVVFNTSGTTGFSKLVPHTNRRFLPAGNILKNLMNIEEQDVLYSSRSLGWYGGFPHLYHCDGCKNVMFNQAHGPLMDMTTHMIKVFEEEKCDHANIAGAEIERILDRLDGPLSRLLKTIVVGGGPMTTFIERAIGKITKLIVVGYGGTEFGFVSSFMLNKDNTFETFCVGKTFNAVELKILNMSLEPVPESEQGEIYIRSPYVGDSYLNDPEKTKASFLEDGWFKTGDLGYIGNKGYIFVLGRMVSAVMKGAYIFYPGWLEALILECSGIKTVAVIGVPDPEVYEDICLCVIRTADKNLTQETVTEFCQNLFLNKEDKDITPMPKYTLFFDEFPMNLNLKVDRVALRAKACKRLNIKL